MKIIYHCLFVVVTLLSLCLQAAAQEKNARPPTPVETVKASMQSLAPNVLVAGTVISHHDARIAAEVDGRLVNVAEIGTTVNKGDVLAQLDKTFTQEALQEIRANSRSQKAKLDFASKEVKRLQRLARENATARNLLDQSIADRDVAASELAVAQSRIRQAQERLLRSQIKAPFNGVVSERYLDTGEWAERGNAVLRLVSIEDLEVQLRIPAHYLPFIQTGQSLDIRQAKLRDQGIVRALVPVGDDQSRLYELRLSVEGKQWQSGQTVQVVVPTAEEKQVLSIPRDALVLRRDGIKVFVINDKNIATPVAITTGIASGSLIEVHGDIKEGDQVVIRGGERLRPGEKVQLKNRNSE